VKSTSPGPAFRGARRFAVLALAASVLAGCVGSNSDSAPQDPKDLGVPAADIHPSKQVATGGALRIGLETFPATFNPVHTDGIISTAPQILAPTLGSAIKIGQNGSWSVDKDYATSVKVTKADPLVVRVELNPSACWQGGTPITAADMVSYAAAMKSDDFAAAAAPVFDQIKTVVPDGKFAYEVKFKKPTADWPSAVYPLLPAVVTKDASIFNEAFTAKAPPANGPFRVASIERKTGTIKLERNPRWWGKPAKLDEIIWRIGQSPVLARAFRARELEAVPVTTENRTDFVATSHVRASAGSQWSQLTLNGGAGPLGDANVRRAVMLAIDTNAIVKETSKQYAARTEAMESVVVLPTQRGFTEGSGMKRDLTKAKKLLAGAGWQAKGESTIVQKNGKPLSLRLPVPAGNRGAAIRAELIVEDLAEVGIDVKLETVAEKDFFSQVVIPLNFDLVTFTWETSAYSIASTKLLFTPIDSPLNFTGKASGAIGKAFDQAIATLTQDRLAKQIQNVDEVARAQASIMPLAVIPNVQAVRSRVVNYGPTALADLDWTIVGFAKKQG